MKILHLSDIHLEKNRSNLLDDLYNYLKNDRFDICFFTGDLINKFAYSLSEAYDDLEELCRKLKIKNFYICCGNHDINRKLAQPIFIKQVTAFKSHKEVDDFVIEDEAKQFSNNLAHISDYTDLMKDKYRDDIISNLYSIHNFNLDGKSISIVSLNFSWSAFNDDQQDKETKGKIVYPISVLEEVSNKIKHSDFKIALSHYPTDFISPVCRKEIVKQLHKSFDCYFCGHSHEYDFSVYQFSDTGIFTSVSPSTISKNNENNIGLVKLDLNLNTYEVEVINTFFKNKHFTDDKKITFEIPKDEFKKTEISLYQHIMTKRENFLDIATKKFVSFDEQNGLNFLDIYTEPILKDKDVNDEIVLKDVKTVSRSNEFKLRELDIETNYLIYGKDKSGKTSLLHKIMLDYLFYFNHYASIPIYLDLSSFYKENTNNIDFDHIIKSEFNLSNNLYQKVINRHTIRILLDNLDPDKKEMNDFLFNKLSEMENVYFTAVCENYLKSTPITLNGSKYVELYLTDISRAKIRELTYKWPIKPTQNRDDVVEKVTKLFSQLNIHCNFWTVTMFLSILDKTGNIKLHSNSDLINLYVERILEKHRLYLNKNKTFQYNDYLTFLSQYAYFLYKHKFKKNYSSSFKEIVDCFDEFQKPFPRMNASSLEILSYIIDRGIIISFGNDCFTFRLNAIFEYFLAYYLLHNKDFLNDIFTSNNSYLSFKNELELYAGFVRNDEDLLSMIYVNTLEVNKQIEAKYSNLENYEKVITFENQELKPLLEIASEIKDEILPMSNDEQDTINDYESPLSNIESAVKLKLNYDIESIDSEFYSKHLFILGRVFKNLDKVQDLKLLEEIFKFLLDQSCMLVYYQIADLFEYISKDNPKLTDINDWISNLNIFSPLVAHSFLFDIINHPTIEMLIKNEIKELEKNTKSNQFKLFVLYFLLIESDPDNEIESIDKLIHIVTLWNIEYSIFIKLLMILSFKTKKDTTLFTKVKIAIEKIHKKMYPGTDEQNNPISNKGIINEIVEKIV